MLCSAPGMAPQLRDITGASRISAVPYLWPDGGKIKHLGTGQNRREGLPDWRDESAYPKPDDLTLKEWRTDIFAHLAGSASTISSP